MNLPEDIRPYATPKNPFARKELWKSQDQLHEEIKMRKVDWYPNNTEFNIYNQNNHEHSTEIVENNSGSKNKVN